ncbi:ribosome hibernation-promoting factor, HPF/YfiA family [Phenylobacterium sp. J367]|uniref:ribosome hibernation-promoting factor, HPF/YfiA family n=1 Tax=Phenylobacterium sp. J367 TaxID=2898435 RepID=UPI0021509901|nr:ribosome-associated translation inhibitor RaiA [Phenylobacterium sp. J367]MCR5878337.1 ribosome-associated translation inhibitor RaiA [Phenylobacterium sp. J367]
MQVQVTGKHVDVGEALRSRVSDQLSTSVEKYFDRGGGADVVVTREGQAFKVDCAVTLASGQQLTTHGVGGDAHMAFDAALAKMDKRIRRYKNRLKDHSIAAQAKQAEEAAAYFIIAPTDEDEEWEGEESQPGFPEPIIIAETEKPVRTMTVSMAVLDLDLTESQTIVFRNAAHGGLSVVYRRPDGNIGWIDPERTRNGNGGGDGTGAAQ